MRLLTNNGIRPSIYMGINFNFVRMHKIFLSPPDIRGNELRYVQEAFASNYVAPLGPMTEAFEKALSAYTKIPYCLALNSGTSALHLMLAHLSIQPGDVILASDVTFIASVSYAYHMGAELRFIDSDAATWNMDSQCLKKALEDGKKEKKLPKAVIVTDLYGQCADYDALRSLCEPEGIPLLIDSCEALGATYKGTHAGSKGFASAFSFNGNKIITTSGGGALLSHDESFIQHARKLSTQARENCSYYEHREVGFNYRMSNICAAIGLGQLEGLEEKLAKKRSIFAYYKTALASLGERIDWMPQAPYGQPNHWLTVMQLNPKETAITPDELLSAMEQSGIEGRRVWKPMHLQPVFRKNRYYGNGVGESLFAKGVCLPSGTALTESQREQVASVIRKTLA